MIKREQKYFTEEELALLDFYSKKRISFNIPTKKNVDRVGDLARQLKTDPLLPENLRAAYALVHEITPYVSRIVTPEEYRAFDSLYSKSKTSLLKDKAITILGGRCANETCITRCISTTNIILNIDHKDPSLIYPAGLEPGTKTSRNFYKLVLDLEEEERERLFQVLCANCNSAKRNTGSVPAYLLDIDLDKIIALKKLLIQTDSSDTQAETCQTPQSESELLPEPILQQTQKS